MKKNKRIHNVITLNKVYMTKLWTLNYFHYFCINFKYCSKQIINNNQSYARCYKNNRLFQWFKDIVHHPFVPEKVCLATETLFQIPGIGYTSYQCIVQGDIPFVMFYMLFLAILILLGNLIADILYAVVDPRVRVN